MKTRGLFLFFILLISPFFYVFSEEPVVTQISVSTNIAGAEVFLNGLLMGTAPLIISPVAPGLWRLTVRKRGYYQEFRMIKIEEGDQKEFFIPLTEITGTLIIQNAPKNAEFLYGDKKTQTSRFLLPEGIHSITIRAFGYIERTIETSIYQNSDTVLDGTLELATFEVSAFRATKKSFNPENPSNLGKAEFAFSVSAPGKGSLEIANEQGTIIKNINLPSFSTWNQHFYWEGTDNFDNSIPDGMYLVTLITSDEKAHTAKVYIDRSIHYPLSGSMYGTSSTGPVELSVLLPQGSFAFNFNVALTNAGPIPGITLSLGLPAYIEAGFRAGMLTNSEQKKEDYISVSLKKGISAEPFSTALLARFAYGSGERPQAISGVKNGFAVGVATGFSTATCAFHGELELLNGNTNGLPSTESFSLAGGLIARLFFGPLSTSVWTRYESGYFNSLFFNSASLMPGLSLHAIIPQTNLTLNIDLGYAITRQQQLFFLYTGFGVLF